MQGRRRRTPTDSEGYAPGERGAPSLTGVPTAVVATVAVVVSLLLVPVTGAVSQLAALRGDTPRQPGPGGVTGNVTALGSVEISASPETREGIYGRVPVGGLSGFDCDTSGDTFWDTSGDTAVTCLAVSDDPGNRGPVRAYPLDPVTGTVGTPVVFTDSAGVPYRPGTVEPESIRLLRTGPGPVSGMVWSAERSATVTVADRSGRARYTLPVPEGTRPAQGLEGLAVVPQEGGGVSVVTATEAAPAGRSHPVVTVHGQDGPTVFEWPGRGISEILDGPQGSLLVLERGYSAGEGNSAVLWRTDWKTDAGGDRLLVRRPVADLGVLFGAGRVGNVEALAWGPRGQDGRRVLYAGTDDNFSAPPEGTQRAVVHSHLLDAPDSRF